MANEDGSISLTATEFEIDHILELKVVSSIHDYDSELIQIESYHVVSYSSTTLII